VVTAIGSVRDALISRIKESGSAITILGPAAAPLEKIAGNYRHHIILKSADLGALRAVIAGARDAVALNDVYLEIDIDPYDMM
jgi:primosomal protein N' (replication factor Y)